LPLEETSRQQFAFFLIEMLLAFSGAAPGVEGGLEEVGVLLQGY
jgi:hypothetical protein